MHSPRTLFRIVATWPVESQQRARRNALVASTELAQRRHERQEVDEFLALHTRRRAAAVHVADGFPDLPAGGELERRDVI